MTPGSIGVSHVPHEGVCPSGGCVSRGNASDHRHRTRAGWRFCIAAAKSPVTTDHELCTSKRPIGSVLLPPLSRCLILRCAAERKDTGSIPAAVILIEAKNGYWPVCLYFGAR